MTRDELMQEIDKRFEMYSDGQVTLEETRTYVRYAVSEFCDEIAHGLHEINETLSKVD